MKVPTVNIDLSVSFILIIFCVFFFKMFIYLKVGKRLIDSSIFYPLVHFPIRLQLPWLGQTQVRNLNAICPPTWVSGAQALEPAFPALLDESPAGTPIRNVGDTRTGLTWCATAMVPRC